jgi:hypothetical protein
VLHELKEELNNVTTAQVKNDKNETIILIKADNGVEEDSEEEEKKEDSKRKFESFAYKIIND